MKRTLKYLLRREVYNQTRKAIRGLEEAGEQRRADDPEPTVDVGTRVSGRAGEAERIDANLKRVLQSMDDYAFEHFVADLWECMGWETAVSTQSADRGIDVVATRRSPYEEKALIQAKRYGPNSTVGSPEIQQYASLKHQRHGVDKVIVVTTNGFSSQAEELAHQLNVKLVDGEDLVELVEELDATGLVEEYVPVVREPDTEADPDPEAEPKIDASGPEPELGESEPDAVGSEPSAVDSMTGSRPADPSRSDGDTREESEGRLARRLPDERWKWVAGATALWPLALALGGADGGVSLLLAWVTLPYAILKDGTWTRWRRWYAAAALVPGFAMLVGAWYLVMRWRAVGLESLDGADGADLDTSD